MAAMGAVGIVIAPVAARDLLPAAPDVESAGFAEEAGTSLPAEGAGSTGRVWLLAVLALMVMRCEDAANDWSAPHLKDVMGASAGAAAFAYGTFAAAMAVGRLFADRVAARSGSLTILRHGVAVAAVGDRPAGGHRARGCPASTTAWSPTCGPCGAAPGSPCCPTSRRTTRTPSSPPSPGCTTSTTWRSPGRSVRPSPIRPPSSTRSSPCARPPAGVLFVDDREEIGRAARTVGMNGHIFDGRDDLAAAVEARL
ncbi:hypothetical protein SANTM175S_07938 [Streptomyces antimycoticus]